MNSTTFDYIDSDQKLIAFSAQLSGAEWLAVDTEFMRERTYYAQLALIQVASEQGNACIDPVAVKDLSPLHAIMQDTACVKIMHSASQDLEILKQVFSFVPQPLFDTQVAAGFLGAADQISYASIVKNHLNIELDKEQTRTNWLQRPLTAAQIKYAQLDVLHLHEIYTQLQTQLAEQGRDDWHVQECATLVQRYEQEDLVATAWQRIKSVQNMDVAAQQVVKILSAWREQVAQQKDLPREWVLGKQVIVELANIRPKNMQQLTHVESLTSKQFDRLGNKLLTLVNDVSDEEKTTTIEPLSVPLDVAQRKQAKTLMAALRERAEKMGVTPALLANRNAVESLVRGERNLALLQTWRKQEVGDHLLQLLDAS